MREDIRKRVERQSLESDGRCYICGCAFKSNACSHSYADQDTAREAMRVEKLLGARP